jgi:L-fuconolactonase
VPWPRPRDQGLCPSDRRLGRPVSDVIVDSHVHVLQAEREYSWMVDEVTRSLKSYSLGELGQEFADNKVAAGIVVQAVGERDESAELLRLATSHSFICGVIGWVDLTGSSVERDLRVLREGEGGSLLVGVRHQTHDESDPLWLTRPEVLRGLEIIAAHGLPFDLLIRPREVPAALALASKLPQLKMVVDHLAKPVIESGPGGEWHKDLIALAQHPNVYCKLSGLTTEVAPLGGWTPSLLHPFLSTALEIFGATRCMFGSDWPVSRLAARYSDVVDLAMVALAPLAASDRAAVLALNAINVYDVSIDPSDSVRHVEPVRGDDVQASRRN